MPVRTTTADHLVTAPAPSRSPHRADLDGLRGLAIALVVVFHIWFGRVSGGVDVFLTLAGFFFVGSLVRSAESASPLDPRPVLLRTARRLLAPLVLVLAATTVAAVLLVAPTSWVSLAEQGRASLLFWENWHLAETASDYLAADPSVSPLQHLWSISVQGQFYLAALLVVFALAWVLRLRGHAVRGPVTALLAVATALSLGYATFGAHPQTWMYYDTGARLWELLAGGLLACVAPSLRIPRSVRILLGATGLLAIVATGVVLDGRQQFPGPWALVPVGATLAIIAAGSVSSPGAPATPDTPTARLLASVPLQRLGEIAYALYLWHWPVLIFTLILRDRQSVGVVGGAGVIVVSTLLAYATTRLVEEPIRRGARTPRRRVLVTAVAAAGVTVFAVTSAWVATIATRSDELAHIADLNPQDYPGAAALTDGADFPVLREQPSRLVAHLDFPDAWPDGCVATDEVVEPVRCTYGDPDAQRSVALIGGSHSEHWLPALQVLARDHGLRIDTYLKVGCPVTLPDEAMFVDADVDPGECERWSAAVVDALETDEPDLVFTTSTRPREDGLPGDHTPDGYVRVWDRLDTLGLTTAVVRDTPWLTEDGVSYRAPDCLAHGGDSETCGVDRGQALDVVDPALDATANLPAVHPLDLSDSVCRAERCNVIEGNILIYRDSDHLSTAYVRSLAPELERQLGPVTGWW